MVRESMVGWNGPGVTGRFCGAAESAWRWVAANRQRLRRGMIFMVDFDVDGIGKVKKKCSRPPAGIGERDQNGSGTKFFWAVENDNGRANPIWRSAAVSQTSRSNSVCNGRVEQSDAAERLDLDAAGFQHSCAPPKEEFVRHPIGMES